MALTDILGGAVTGFLTTGNPLGAGLGALSGILGSGQGNRTTTASTSPNYRAWTPGESAIMSNIEKALQRLTAGTGDTAAREEAIYGEQYGAAAQGISDAWTKYGGAMDAKNLRRGGGQSSRMLADQQGVKAGMSKDLAGAAVTARSAARATIMDETNQARADQQALAQLYKTLQNARQGGSTTTNVGANTAGLDTAAALGSALGDRGSWLNTTGLPSAWRGISSLFGGGSEAKPNNVLSYA